MEPTHRQCVLEFESQSNPDGVEGPDWGLSITPYMYVKTLPSKYKFSIKAPTLTQFVVINDSQTKKKKKGKKIAINLCK